MSVVLRPCMAPPKRCPPDHYLSNRVCAAKASRGSWDSNSFRSKLLMSFLARTNVELACGPRVAIVSFDDYNETDVQPHAGGHYGTAASLRHLASNCVASLTFQASMAVPPRDAAGAPIPWSLERPIVIPDPYYLMTAGYTHGVRGLHGRFNGTRDSLSAESASSPWRSKRFSCVWRGTHTSDVSGDRLRLVQAAARLRATGVFTAAQLDVQFSECNKPEVPNAEVCENRSTFAVVDRGLTHESSAFMSYEDMLRSRGVISVDGIGNEWTLIWKLLANCVTLLVESNRTWQWYHPLLLPWKQCAPHAAAVQRCIVL